MSGCFAKLRLCCAVTLSLSVCCAAGASERLRARKPISKSFQGLQKGCKANLDTNELHPFIVCSCSGSSVAEIVANELRACLWHPLTFFDWLWLLGQVRSEHYLEWLGLVRIVLLGPNSASLLNLDARKECRPLLHSVFWTTTYRMLRGICPPRWKTCLSAPIDYLDAYWFLLWMPNWTWRWGGITALDLAVAKGFEEGGEVWFAQRFFLALWKIHRWTSTTFNNIQQLWTPTNNQ